MKRIIIAFLYLLIFGTSCTPQGQISETEATKYLKKDIERIELPKLVLLPNELIEACTDSAVYIKFANRIRLYNGMKHKTSNDTKELNFSLHLLNISVYSVPVKMDRTQQSKAAILKALNEYKSFEYKVNQKFIFDQIDESKRGLLNGYDEGVTSESRFLFFCFNPVLFKETLKNNGLDDSWSRVSIFLCNYLRENETPVAIRLRLKQQVTSILTKNIDDIEIKNALNEFMKCDVSKNRFD